MTQSDSELTAEAAVAGNTSLVKRRIGRMFRDLIPFTLRRHEMSGPV